MDSDGKPDIVTAGQKSNPLKELATVRFNLGGGTFGPPVEVVSPRKVRSVAVADITGDGAKDLVVAASEGTYFNSVNVYANTGNQTFATGVSYTVPFLPSSIAVGDLDGNGSVDVAVSSGKIVVLLNAGDGTLSIAGQYFGAQQATQEAKALVMADFDGDAKLDLAVSGGPYLSILKNVGGGAFGPAEKLGTSTARAVAVGDLDGDGDPDLAVGTAAGVTTHINVAGKFATRLDHSVSAPKSLTVGDIDGNGQADLVMAGTGDGVAVRLNQGGGAFGPRIIHPAPPGASDSTLGDLDGDGQPDLVVGTSQGALSVFKNTGAGQFTHVLDRNVGTGQLSTSLADVDGDGKPDLVAADCASGKIALATNNGNLAFGAATFLDAGGCPRDVAAGELDSDGYPDLVVANGPPSGPYSATVLLSNGPGAFQPGVVYTAQLQPRAVGLADFDTDGDLDLAVAAFLNGSVGVFKNQGAGVFGPRADVDVSSNPVALAIGDFDADGLPDMATGDQFSLDPEAGNVSVVHNTGGGTFAPPVTLSLAGPGVEAIVSADLDGDGTLDLPLVDTVGVGVHTGNGNGTFGSREYIEFSDGVPSALAAGDMDGDGLPELVVGGEMVFGSGIVGLLHNAGGEFIHHEGVPTGIVPIQMAVADFDGDGTRDFALAKDAHGGYMQGAVEVFLQQPGGGFVGTETVIGWEANGFAVGDLDGDAHIDLVATNGYDNVITVLLNDGAGNFSSTVDFAASDPKGVAIGDLDGDSDLDLLVANGSYDPNSEEIAIFWNDGAGVLAAGPTFTLAGAVNAVAVADVDADGNADLLASGSGTLRVFLGQGSGAFGSLTTYPTGGSTHAMRLADLDGDGFLDAVFVAMGSNVLRIMRNTGAGAFQPHREYPTGKEPSAVTTADFDGDGRLDIAVANRAEGSISLLRGTCW